MYAHDTACEFHVTTVTIVTIVKQILYFCHFSDIISSMKKVDVKTNFNISINFAAAKICERVEQRRREIEKENIMLHNIHTHAREKIDETIDRERLALHRDPTSLTISKNGLYRSRTRIMFL